MKSNILAPDAVVIEEDYGLQCPGCGCNNLHQGAINVFERPEDSDTTIQTTVTKTATMVAVVPSNTCGNPSSRRQGLSIQFSCEQCRVAPVMHIFQHKGTTYFEWDGKKLIVGIARDKMLPEDPA